MSVPTQPVPTKPVRSKRVTSQRAVAGVTAGQFIASGQVTVGGGPVDVAVTPDGTQAYVADFVAGTVSVLETSTQKVTATISVGAQPYRVAVTPDGAYAYVTLYNSAPGQVVVIDTTTASVKKTITVGAGGGTGITIAPDGLKAYVTNYLSDTISVIDTASLAEDSDAEISLGDVDSNPWDVAVTLDSKVLYATSALSGNVVIVDIASKKVTKTLDAGLELRGVRIAPDGDHAYVVSRSPGSVAVIDTATTTVTATITVGTNPSVVAVSPVGGLAFIANGDDDTVSVLDTTKNVVAYIAHVGSSPQGVAVTPDGTVVYVANTGKLKPGASHTVSVLEHAAAPVFTSPTAATATAGQVFPRFPITVTGNPASMTLTSPAVAGTMPGGNRIPQGLVLNTTTVPFGITGTVDASVKPGVYSLDLNATNGVSPDATQTLTITVDAVLSPPQFTSLTTAIGTIGEVLAQFEITFTGHPTPTLSTPIPPAAQTTPGADRLPKGLVLNVDTSPFEVRGTVDSSVERGEYLFGLKATNGVGADATEQCRVVVVASAGTAPIFTSADTVTGAAGQPFTFQVTVQGSPASTVSTSAASNASTPGGNRLPKGLTLNTGAAPV